MADYNLKVTAQRITGTLHTLQDGSTIPSDSTLAGSYAVEMPDGKTIILADIDFEGNSSPFLA